MLAIDIFLMYIIYKEKKMNNILYFKPLNNTQDKKIDQKLSDDKKKSDLEQKVIKITIVNEIKITLDGNGAVD